MADRQPFMAATHSKSKRAKEKWHVFFLPFHYMSAQPLSGCSIYTTNLNARQWTSHECWIQPHAWLHEDCVGHPNTNYNNTLKNLSSLLFWTLIFINHEHILHFQVNPLSAFHAVVLTLSFHPVFSGSDSSHLSIIILIFQLPLLFLSQLS